MIQFALNEEQIAVRDMARDFSARKIAPHALKWDEEKFFPVDVMKEAAALGMAGIYVRDDLGGSAMTRLDAALIFEALAQGCPTTSAFISIRSIWCAAPSGSMRRATSSASVSGCWDRILKAAMRRTSRYQDG